MCAKAGRADAGACLKCSAANGVSALRVSVFITSLEVGQLSIVFDVDRSVIGKHIRNVYKTGELVKEATWAKIAHVQREGGRQVKRSFEDSNELGSRRNCREGEFIEA